MTQLYQTGLEKANHFLSEFNTELNTTSEFEVIKETKKGAVVRNIDNPKLTAFAYTSLLKGSIILASITKINFFDNNTPPFVLAVIESVIEYPEYAA